VRCTREGTRELRADVRMLAGHDRFHSQMPTRSPARAGVEPYALHRKSTSGRPWNHQSPYRSSVNRALRPLLSGCPGGRRSERVDDASDRDRRACLYPLRRGATEAPSWCALLHTELRRMATLSPSSARGSMRVTMLADAAGAGSRGAGQAAGRQYLSRV